MMNNFLCPPWLEVKVLYVRVSSCPLEGIPESLWMTLAPRTSEKQQLEVNSAHIPLSQEVFLSLRRDRMDSESAEVTYVTTDSLRALGMVKFHIRDERKEPLVEGVFKVDPMTGRWIMECSVGAAAGVFSKSRNCGELGSSPSMEVSLIGCSGGAPLIITETVQLTGRKRGNYHTMLDPVSEDDDSSSAQEEDAGKEAISRFISPEPSSFGEEMSWFNAGVRVGVGIGLGMCLGVGIGVGLLVRTYQATTNSFRRRLF